MTEKEWFYIENIDDVDTPFLAIFPERVRANIQALKKIIPDTNRLRPHVKPHKCKQVVTRMLEEDISKFKCATIAEAEMLALAGASDVLLAFQPVGPKIKRLLGLMTSYPSTTFACLVDNEENAKAIGSLARIKNINVNVWLDLNTGMNATGTHPGNALELYKTIGLMNELTLAGIHAYDGYIADADAEVRKIKSLEAFRKIRVLKNEIMNAGLSGPMINTGRTATLNFYADYADTECSPGTFIYWDQLHEELYAELPFEAAAIVVARVVSLPGDDMLCLDLGNKAVSAAGNLQQLVHFLNIPNVEIIEQSDEWMIVKSAGNNDIKIGEVLYGIPYNIGRTCNLYQTASTVSNHQLRGQWVHFTDRKLSI